MCAEPEGQYYTFRSTTTREPEPSPVSRDTVPFKSVASMYQGKMSRAYATASLGRSPALVTARRAGPPGLRNHCFWKTVPPSLLPLKKEKKKIYIYSLGSSKD